MEKTIFISIKPQYTKLIENGKKNYEFRNYIPKEKINTLYVYESYPTCCFKYIIILNDIVKYPNKIDELGIGNIKFNNGLSTKYAYSIKEVYVLEKPIPLKILKEKFNFTPPQSYAYSKTYLELYKYINKSKKIKLIE